MIYSYYNSYRQNVKSLRVRQGRWAIKMSDGGSRFGPTLDAAPETVGEPKARADVGIG